MKEEFRVQGYDFNVGEYLKIINDGFRNKQGRDLTMTEQKAINESIGKNIENYAIIATNVGIDPRDLNNPDTGIPDFVKLKEREPTKDERKILREKNPSYMKQNIFGQTVPMTVEEAKQVGFKNRNLLLSTVNNLIKSGVGAAAYMVDIQRGDEGAIPSPVNIIKNFTPPEVDTFFNNLSDRIIESVPQEVRDYFTKLKEGVDEIKENDLAKPYVTVITQHGRVFRQPRKEFFKLTESVYKKMFRTDLRKDQDEMMQNAVDYWNDRYAERTPTGRIDIDDALARKDIAQLSEFTATALVESMPVMLLAMKTRKPMSLFSSIGVMATGNQYANIRDRDDMTQYQKNVNATGYGVVEGAFETFLGYGAIIRHITKNPIVKKALLTNVGKIAWRVTGGALSEGTEEIFTGIGQDIVAFGTGEKEFDSLGERAKEYLISGAIGAIGGGAFTITGMAVNRGGDVIDTQQGTGEAPTPQDTGDITPVATPVPKQLNVQESIDVAETAENTANEVKEVQKRNFYSKEVVKVVETIRSKYVEGKTAEQIETINTKLNKTIGEQTVAEFIESKAKHNYDYNEIVNELKKNRVASKEAIGYAKFIDNPMFLAQFMTPDPIGEIASRLEDGTATTKDARRYIKSAIATEQKVQQFKNDLEELKTNIRDAKKLRVEADKLWKQYMKGVPAKFTKTDMGTVIRKIRMIKDVDSFENSINEIVKVMDKYKRKAFIQSIKGRAKSKVPYISAFNEPMYSLINGIKTDGIVDIAGLIEAYDANRVGMGEGATEYTKAIESLDGININDMTLEQSMLLHDFLNQVDVINRRMQEEIYDGKNIVQAQDEAIKYIKEQATKVQDKATKKALDRMIKAFGFTGEADMATLSSAVFGMRFTDDTNTQIKYSAVEELAFRALEKGSYISQEMEVECLRHIRNNLTKEEQAMLMGRHRKYSRNMHEFTFDGKKTKLSLDAITYIYLLSKRAKANYSLMNGGIRNKTFNHKGVEKNPIFKFKHSDIVKFTKIVEGDPKLKHIIDVSTHILEEILHPKSSYTYERIWGRPLNKDEFYTKIFRDDVDFEKKTYLRSFLNYNIENAGYTRTTSWNNKPLDIHNFSYVLNRMIKEQSHFHGMAEPIINQQLFYSSKVRTDMKNYSGKKLYDFTLQYMNDMSSVNFQPEGFEKFLGKARGRLAGAKLLYKAFVIARQPISIFLSIAGSKRYTGVSGYKYILPEMFKKRTLSSAELYELAPWVEFRREGAMLLFTGNESFDLNTKSKNRAISEADFLAIRLQADGIYKGMKANGTFTPKAFNETLQTLTDRTQPTWHMATKSRIQRSDFGRNFAMFFSGINKTMNLSLQNLQFMSAGGNKKDGLAMLGMIYLIVNTAHVLIDRLRDLSLGKKFDLSPKKFARDVALKGLDMSMPLRYLSAFIKKVSGDRGYAPNVPLIEAGADIGSSIASLATGAWKGDKTKMLNNLEKSLTAIDSFAGFGVDGIIDVIRQTNTLVDVATGEGKSVEEEVKEVEEEVDKTTKEIELEMERAKNSLVPWYVALHNWINQENKKW